MPRASTIPASILFSDAPGDWLYKCDPIKAQTSVRYVRYVS